MPTDDSKHWIQQIRDHLMQDAEPQVTALWMDRCFSNGSVERRRVEPLTRELLAGIFIEHFTPKLNRMFIRDGSTERVRADWWEGLPAYAGVMAREIAEQVGALIGERTSVDRDTWIQAAYTALRGGHGQSGSIGSKFPARWWDNQAFVSSWLTASSMAGRDPRHVRLFSLAHLWDAFVIPLRFFTDEAALRALNVGLEPLMLPPVGLDTYRKDLRGARGGLGLQARHRRHAVVRFSESDPYVLLVSRSKAVEAGLSLQRVRDESTDEHRQLHFAMTE